MDLEEILKEELIEKVEKELELFKQKLKKMTPKEIIESAYELTVKKEIISGFQEMYLDVEELKPLLKEDNILDKFYKDWENSDGRLGEQVYLTMPDSVETVVADYKEEKKQKNRESR